MLDAYMEGGSNPSEEVNFEASDYMNNMSDKGNDSLNNREQS